MANCRDFTYIIAFTDNAKALIQLQQTVLDQDTVDIALVGKTRLAYGEIFNENILHLMEHFASNSSSNSPDINSVTYPIFRNPTFGQIWFNKTNSITYVYGADQQWRPIVQKSSTVGNSGTVLDGETIPLPVTATNISDCQILVSPFFFSNIGIISTYDVRVDSNGLVTAKYTVNGTEYSGSANYIILYSPIIPGGLRNFCGEPEPSTTPSQTPVSTTTPTPTPTATPTPIIVVPTLDSGNLYGWGPTEPEI